MTTRAEWMAEIDKYEARIASWMKEEDIWVERELSLVAQIKNLKASLKLQDDILSKIDDGTIARLDDELASALATADAEHSKVMEIEGLNATLQERNFRYLSALTDIGCQDENALCYLPTAHLKGQRARKAIH